LSGKEILLQESGLDQSVTVLLENGAAGEPIKSKTAATDCPIQT
jgi:hypothetical protein